MRKVSEYEEHAAECRQLAARSHDPNYKAELEKMAEAWERLARIRLDHLAKRLRK